MANANALSVRTVSPGNPYGEILNQCGFPAHYISQGNEFPIAILGYVMRPGNITEFYGFVKIDSSISLATGLTFELLYCLPGSSGQADVSGTQVYMGVAVGKVTSGTTTFNDITSLTGTEVLAQSGALPTTLWTLVKQTIAVPVANMLGLATGDTAIIRVRRKGDDLNNDTNTGDILLVNVAAWDT